MDQDISILVGKTFDRVTRDDESVSLDGAVPFHFAHEQDCCERVWLEDVTGDLSDLEGTPILSAVCESNTSDTEGGDQTWTFYHLRTIKGTVTLRFCGESNGYYSTSVTLFGGGE